MVVAAARRGRNLVDTGFPRDLPAVVSGDYLQTTSSRSLP